MENKTSVDYSALMLNLLSASSNNED